MAQQSVVAQPSTPTLSQASTRVDSTVSRHASHWDNASRSLPVLSGAGVPTRHDQIGLINPVPFLDSTLVSNTPTVRKPLHTFIFRTTIEGPALRVKDTSVCNTIQKLFAHSRQAQIATKDTVTLLLHVIGKGTARMVQDDTEDFDTFLQMLSSEEDGTREIMVLPDEA